MEELPFPDNLYLRNLKERKRPHPCFSLDNSARVSTKKMTIIFASRNIIVEMVVKTRAPKHVSFYPLRALFGREGLKGNRRFPLDVLVISMFGKIVLVSGQFSGRDSTTNPTFTCNSFNRKTRIFNSVFNIR